MGPAKEQTYGFMIEEVEVQDSGCGERPWIVSVLNPVGTRIGSC